MSFDLAHIWAEMNGLSKSIAFFLFCMAIASVGVTIERWIAFSKGNRSTRAFIAEARTVFENWQLDQVKALAVKHKASPLATIFDKMCEKYLGGVADKGAMTPVELAKNEAARRLEAVGADLRRGFSILATVGSISPFVGLLGTVVGIIGAFAGIGAAGSAGIGAVSAGISEALIETAFGLMVAIPAVLFYNYLTARVAAIELALGRSVGELLDEMENNHGRESRRRIEKVA